MVNKKLVYQSNSFKVEYREKKLNQVNIGSDHHLPLKRC